MKPRKHILKIGDRVRLVVPESDYPPGLLMGYKRSPLDGVRLCLISSLDSDIRRFAYTAEYHELVLDDGSRTPSPGNIRFAQPVPLP